MASALATESKEAFYLNIYSKNNVGAFHLIVYNKKSNSSTPAVSMDKVKSAPRGLRMDFFQLPNEGINELVLTASLSGEGEDPDASRGFWMIDFDISCIGSDREERTISPRYSIMARNYFDELKQDKHGNGSFKIYLIKNFTTADCAAMLHKNYYAYDTFKTITGRQ